MNHEIHKYRRTDIGRDKPYIVYQCALNCSHYLIPTLVIGKLCLCWRCLKPFELKRSNLKVKPTCKDCKLVRESQKEKSESDKLYEKILGF